MFLLCPLDGLIYVPNLRHGDTMTTSGGWTYAPLTSGSPNHVLVSVPVSWAMTLVQIRVLYEAWLYQSGGAHAPTLRNEAWFNCLLCFPI